MLYNYLMLYALIICNLLMLVVFFLHLNSLPPQIPLFFSRSWGEDQLADTWFILTLPVILNFLYFFNFSIYNRFFPKNNFVKKIIIYLNLSLMIVITFIFIKIITLIS